MSNNEVLLAAHHRLDFESRSQRGRIFVSTWYCEHPFVDSILPQSSRNLESRKRLLDYYFQNDVDLVHREIQRFHSDREETPLGLEEIFITSGMSPLITALLLMLSRAGVTTLYYVRPLYYSVYFLADVLGISLVPVNEAPLLSEDVSLELPELAESWLILCDPIWFAGRSVHHSAIQAISDWQRKYGGKVFVDGAFQYQKWATNGRLIREASADLVAEQTIRGICPTKAAALHGPRFAYAICSATMREELRYCYANTAGSGSAFDLGAAAAIMRWLNGPESNKRLLSLVETRYRALTAAGLLQDRFDCDSSYFCFVKLKGVDDDILAMGEEFFDIEGFPDCIRLNLLLPGRDLRRLVTRWVERKELAMGGAGRLLDALEVGES